MNDFLELEFKGRRTEYAVNPQQYPFTRGDLAIVVTDRGHDLGKVSHVGIRTGDSPGEKIALTVLRRARSTDIEKLGVIREREAEAKRLAREEIIRHQLEMKLVDVELQWDGRKMTFYFTAEGRVDFRDLVRELATKFRTRIDLRQIGARDETKKISGYGVCGRPLCCATFLTEFKPITTQMPRDQFLPLNPSKLSGVCGRLKCCLRYELDTYKEFQRDCPKVGHPIKDEDKGLGEVEKIDVVREQIQIRYGGGATERYTKAQFVELTNWRPQMPKNECICTCGKKAGTSEAASKASTDLPVEAQSSVSEANRGDRITLRAEGGFRVDFEDDDEESMDVTTDVNVAMDSPAKRKRKKRRKKAGERNEVGTASGSTPIAGNRAQQREEASASSDAQSNEVSRTQPEQQGASVRHRKNRKRGGRRRHGSASGGDTASGSSAQEETGD